jgi:hypothetical protein
MNLDSILEVAIGLVVTWLILSLATMQIQEVIVNRLGTRSTFLEARLLEMFKNEALKDQFYNHPIIQSLKVRNWGREDKAVNIPNPIFARAAVDILLNAGKTGQEIPAGTMSLDAMRSSMTESMQALKEMSPAVEHTVKFLVPNLDLHKEVSEAGDKAAGAFSAAEKSLAEFRGNVESWFDTTMVQATSMYHKRARSIAFFLGILLALVFNVDSIFVVKQLWLQPTLREAIVAQAQNIKPEDSASNDAIDTLAKNKLDLPVGWTAANRASVGGLGGILLKILGFGISGAAAAQGAPFWFSILNRLLGLKQSQEPKKTEREKT